MILIKFRFRSARRRRSQRNGSAFQPTPIVATLQLLFPPLLPKGRADVFYCFRNRAKKKGVEHNGAKINKQGFSSPNSNLFIFLMHCFASLFIVAFPSRGRASKVNEGSPFVSGDAGRGG